MRIEEYADGPLKGQASVNVLIDAETLRYLKHASEETGYSIDRLVEISVAEAALGHAKTHDLL